MSDMVLAVIAVILAGLLVLVGLLARANAGKTRDRRRAFWEES